jgi:thymidylate synthase (FAD)
VKEEQLNEIKDRKNQRTSTRRRSVQALEDIMFEPFPVLDKGFVRVVDYMGCDEDIVAAARVSYGAGTKKLNEDRGLIRYLIRHRHTSPLEMAELKIHIRIPMDAWRQMVRHRTSSINEYSTRYSIAIDDKKETEPTKWRTQSKSNKQGSGDYLTEWPPNGEIADCSPGEHLSAREKNFHARAQSVYNERISLGVAREQARKDLPLSTYTEAYWKMDLHNLLHFLSLRMDSHAQLEIRQYATVIGKEIVSRWVPLVWEAFCYYDNRFGSSVTLNPKELEALKAKWTFSLSSEQAAKEAGLSGREKKEFLAKLEKVKANSR